MKHFRTITVPETTEKILLKTICDLCNTTINPDTYSIEDVVIKYRIGEEYPDCGSGHETTVDMCSRCFEEKLIPWIKSQGGSPETTEWEW